MQTRQKTHSMAPDAAFYASPMLPCSTCISVDGWTFRHHGQPLCMPCTKQHGAYLVSLSSVSCAARDHCSRLSGTHSGPQMHWARKNSKFRPHLIYKTSRVCFTEVQAWSTNLRCAAGDCCHALPNLHPGCRCPGRGAEASRGHAAALLGPCTESACAGLSSGKLRLQEPAAGCIPSSQQAAAACAL